MQLPTKEDLLNSFARFANWFMDDGYFDKIHIDLCNFIQESGKLITVILPRDFLKSTICSVMYPLWRATKNPEMNIFLVSNTANNAQRLLHKIKEIITNDVKYRKYFPDRIPNTRHSKWSDLQACLRRKIPNDISTFETAGTKTKSTGRHYDLIIEDDTISPSLDDMTQEMAMPSLEDIEQAIGFHKLTIPLLRNYRTGQRLVVGTRWTFKDLIQYVIDNENPDTFDVPAITIEDGKELPTHPLRFPTEVLNQLRNAMGTYYYSALYLNKPRMEKDMVFILTDSMYYTDQAPEGKTVITIDPSGLASSTVGSKDAVISCRHVPGEIYVLQYALKQMLPNELINTGLDFAEEDNATTIKIEAVQYQKSLIYGFEDEMKRRGKFFNIVPLKTRTSKMDRIRGLQPIVERGMLRIRRGMRELEQHLSDFPFGNCLDLLDALAYQLTEIIGGDYHKELKKHKVPWLTYGQVMDGIKAKQMGSYPIPSGVASDSELYPNLQSVNS